MKFESLHDLYIDQLRDLYDAEQQILNVLPKMAGAASTPELKQAFGRHLEETTNHALRLEEIFDALGIGASGKKCRGIRGIIDENEDALELQGDPLVKDAALICAAQRVEHYEMCVYGCASAFARHLGETEAAENLQMTLEEEKAADELMTRLAETTINAQTGAVKHED